MCLVLMCLGESWSSAPAAPCSLAARPRRLETEFAGAFGAVLFGVIRSPPTLQLFARTFPEIPAQALPQALAQAAAQAAGAGQRPAPFEGGGGGGAAELPPSEQTPSAEGLEPKVDAIFAIFATTADSFLDAAQYRTYLKGIGEWAQLECYTDTTWTTEWPAECEMLGADPEKGVDLTAFRRMYTQYRQDKVTLDHARTVAVTTANIGCVVQQHEPSRTVGGPSPPGSRGTVWDLAAENPGPTEGEPSTKALNGWALGRLPVDPPAELGEDAPWPLHKLWVLTAGRAEAVAPPLAAAPSRGPAVVIISGGMNPMHRGHAALLHQAAARLEAVGYHPWSEAGFLRATMRTCSRRLLRSAPSASALASGWRSRAGHWLTTRSSRPQAGRQTRNGLLTSIRSQMHCGRRSPMDR